MSLSLTNTLFFYWILFSLSRILKELREA
jgi:Lung seven transmembrane receptor